MGQVSGDFQMPRMVRALGLCFYVCLFIGRKVTMDFISLTFRFVIKCQTCQNCPNQPFCSCCFSESRDSPAVSLLSSTCLIAPPHGSAHSLWEGTLTPAAPRRDSAAPLTAEACPGSGGLARNLWSLWACMPHPSSPAPSRLAGRPVEQPATHP